MWTLLRKQEKKITKILKGPFSDNVWRIFFHSSIDDTNNLYKFQKNRINMWTLSCKREKR